jgi:hypothetical protein
MSFCWLRSRYGPLPGIGVGGRVTDTGSVTQIGDAVSAVMGKKASGTGPPAYLME